MPRFFFLLFHTLCNRFLFDRAALMLKLSTYVFFHLNTSTYNV